MESQQFCVLDEVYPLIVSLPSLKLSKQASSGTQLYVFRSSWFEHVEYRSLQTIGL